MTNFDPTRECIDLLPARKSSCRGAGVRWCCQTRLLTLTNNKRVERSYRVTELPVDPQFQSRGFSLDKVTTGSDPEADSYAVLISTRRSEFDTCECRGFLRHGHCSHLDGVRTILANGWYEMPPAEYAAWSAAVAATLTPVEDDAAMPITLEDLVDVGLVPQSEPAPACCLCGRPMNGDAGAVGLAHAECERQEWACIHADEAAAAEVLAGTILPLDDDLPECFRGVGCGPRADCPF